jgi:hypothetical protein
MRNYRVAIFVASALTASIVLITQKAQAQNPSPQTTGVIVAAADGTNTNKTQREGSAIFVTEIPEGYRDWKLIAVSRLTAAKGSQLRAELANDIAIRAYREGKLPFPDGAIVAAIHWNEVSSEENNKVLAKGFPGAGIQSFVPGSGVNMQFMVKDSKKYAATGGWGFGDFTSGKPGSATLMKTCFACHVPAKDQDFVFTRYSP